MTNTPRGEGPDPTQPLGPGYSGYHDPAYAGQSPYDLPYQQPLPPDTTRQLPAYSPYGYNPYGTGQYGTGQYGQPYPPGEPPEGIEDIHFHIFEPRQARLYASLLF